MGNQTVWLPKSVDSGAGTIISRQAEFGDGNDFRPRGFILWSGTGLSGERFSVVISPGDAEFQEGPAIATDVPHKLLISTATQ